jgi:hypothetical protein
MIDAPNRTRLQEFIRMENQSLLTYYRHAYPWTKWGGGDTLKRLQTILDDEHRALIALGQYLTRKLVPLPAHGSYPAGFTTANFIALEHLVPQLVEAERRSIADLERDLPAINDLECKVRLEKILDAKRIHLAELENMQYLQPATA